MIGTELVDRVANAGTPGWAALLAAPFVGSLSAARRGAARRPLGVALRAVPGVRDLAGMAAWAVLRVSSHPRTACSMGQQSSGGRVSMILSGAGLLP